MPSNLPDNLYFLSEKDLRKIIFSRWNWLWLWIFPTYVCFSGDSVVFFKKFFGRVYIVGSEMAPWKKVKEGEDG